jgi:hypothetical protein
MLHVRLMSASNTLLKRTGARVLPQITNVLAAAAKNKTISTA